MQLKLENILFVMVSLEVTSAVRAFGPSYFRHSTSVLEPRHIGARPKGDAFWPWLSLEAIETLFCLGCRGTRAIGSQYFF